MAEEVFRYAEHRRGGMSWMTQAARMRSDIPLTCISAQYGLLGFSSQILPALQPFMTLSSSPYMKQVM